MVLRRVLLIGEGDHREFAQATSWLAEHTLLSAVATPAAAARAVQHPAQPPELIVVAQTRPSQFARAEIELVHRLTPLARLVVLGGSWCEGEMRTGHPWPGVLRLYWHQGEARLRQLLRDTNPLWGHPRTGTEVERLLDTPPPRVLGQQKLIAVGTETSVAFHGLSDSLVQAGFAAAWIAPRRIAAIQGAAAGIWDETQHASASEPLRDFVRQLRGAPIVALANFPRLADLRRLQREGVGQVIAKPFLNADLISVVEQQLAADRLAVSRAA